MSPALARVVRMAGSAGLLSLLWPALPGSAHAHGFGKRFDLPIPLDFYLLGAAATVALSFALVAFFVRSESRLNSYPRLNLLRWRAGRFLAHPAMLMATRLASVGVFSLLLAAGLYGLQNPARNIVPTFVWIIWWTGLAYVSALFGDLWALINPWKILFGWAESVYRLTVPTSELGLRLPYPRWLGVWPAFALFVVFVWGELVWENNAIPGNLALAIIAYSCVTWIGMFVFGRHAWLRGGEAFSVAFGLLARFSASEIRVAASSLCQRCSAERCRRGEDCVDCYECLSATRALGRHDGSDVREWNLRPFGVGLLADSETSTSQMAFVVLMLATVSFDGFMATPLWNEAFDTITSTRTLMPFLHKLNMMGMSVDSIVSTIGLILAPLVFLAVYLAFSFFMTLAARSSDRGSPSYYTTAKMARDFVLCLIPIAIAYHLAHYISFLFIAGQLIIPLASDPFGFGWNLLGTADYRIDPGILGARFAWYASVSFVVVGHVIAVYLGHILALRGFERRRSALNSQLPMLALMVFYTFAGLWILAQPIVE
ncbi:MAG: hypothetical protein CL908_14240 [Deltaproteobacteria bacterium]|nr:hypothetical protein [Deltaproteobacteria bacterium]